VNVNRGFRRHEGAGLEKGDTVAGAGQCSECGQNVYLTPEGACPQGHGPECISGHYEIPVNEQPAGGVVAAGPSAAPNASAMITQHSEFAKLPMMVKQQLATLPVAQQQAFMEDFKRRAKSVAVGYIFWLFGLHYAYLGKWGTLLLYWVTAGGLVIWIIVDAFRISRLVGDFNKDVAIDVMSSLRMVSG
jgi:hypothetical protein